MFQLLTLNKCFLGPCFNLALTSAQNISSFNAGLFPAGIYHLPKLTNRNTRKSCEIRLKLAIKTSERRYRRRSGVFIVNSEYISHLDLVFLLLTLNMYLFTLLICTHPNITIKSNFFTSVCITVKDVHEFSVAKHLE